MEADFSRLMARASSRLTAGSLPTEDGRQPLDGEPQAVKAVLSAGVGDETGVEHTADLATMEDAVAALRSIGSEMEDMLASGLPKPSELFDHAEEEPGSLKLGTFQREPAMQHFWLEGQRVAGALLLNHRTAQLQKSQMLKSVQLWQHAAEFDGEIAPVGSREPGDVGDLAHEAKAEFASKVSRLKSVAAQLAAAVRSEQQADRAKVGKLEKEAAGLRSAVIVEQDRADTAVAAAQRAQREQAKSAAEAEAQLAELRALAEVAQARLDGAEARAREAAEAAAAAQRELEEEVRAREEREVAEGRARAKAASPDPAKLLRKEVESLTLELREAS